MSQRLCHYVLCYIVHHHFWPLHLHLRNQIHFNATGLLLLALFLKFTLWKQSFMIKCLAFLFSLLTANAHAHEHFIQRHTHTNKTIYALIFDTFRIYKRVQQSNNTLTHTENTTHVQLYIYIRIVCFFIAFELDQVSILVASTEKIHVAFCVVKTNVIFCSCCCFFYLNKMNVATALNASP